MAEDKPTFEEYLMSSLSEVVSLDLGLEGVVIDVDLEKYIQSLPEPYKGFAENGGKLACFAVDLWPVTVKIKVSDKCVLVSELKKEAPVIE